MGSRNKKVTDFKKRRPLRINIKKCVFLAVSFYIISTIFIYLTRDKVSIYEVVMGKDASITNKTYNALILRDEIVVNSQSSGYLNYFVCNGERISVNSTVYTIDESGTVNDLLSSATDNGDIIFSESNKKDLREKISSYTENASDIDFNHVYDFKLSLESDIFQYINLSNIQNILGESGLKGMNFNIYKGTRTGIVEYYIDGYESKKEENLTENDFSDKSYSKKMITSGSLIETGSAVYKSIHSEKWNLYIKLTENDLDKYKDYTVIKIKFIKDNIITKGDFEIIYIEGKAYGKITLENYMRQYAADRFAEIRVISEEISGLKIPTTSVLEQKCYVIPSDFVTYGGNKEGDQEGVIVNTYDENASSDVSFIPLDFIYSDEDYYYVSTNYITNKGYSIDKGDILLDDDDNTYRIGETKSFKGVYNVNNGYCVFRKVNIISQTGDYYLIEADTYDGLKVFDHIVLNASLTSENVVVFR